MQWKRVPNAGSGYRKGARANGGQSNSRDDQVVGSRGPESVVKRKSNILTALICRNSVDNFSVEHFGGVLSRNPL